VRSSTDVTDASRCDVPERCRFASYAPPDHDRIERGVWTTGTGHVSRLRAPRTTSWAAAIVVAATLGGCSGDDDDSSVDERASAPATLAPAEFCDRWKAVGELQDADESVAAAMELARISDQAPREVAEEMETLYELLEDRLAGNEPDFDAMLDASIAVDEFCT
jgi:hypothetical protein